MRARATWKTWHLLAAYAVGCVVAWVGEGLKDWAGDRLKRAWFPKPPDDEDDDPPDEDEPERRRRR